MELLGLYRKKAFLPWVWIGLVFLAGAGALLYAMRGSDDKSVLWLLLLVYLVGFVTATFPALTGWGTRGFRRYTKGMSPSDKEDLCRQYREGYRFCDAVMTDRCLVILNSKHLDIVPYMEIVWLYEAERTTKLTGATQTLAIVTADKRSHTITMKKKDQKHLREFMDGIRMHKPGVLLGYDRETMRLFRKDFAKLAAQAAAPPPVQKTEPTPPAGSL